VENWGFFLENFYCAGSRGHKFAIIHAQEKMPFYSVLLSRKNQMTFFPSIDDGEWRFDLSDLSHPFWGRLRCLVDPSLGKRVFRAQQE
jgi:hypothetical protein